MAYVAKEAGAYPQYVVVVDQKQGPQGTLTPEALAAKEAVEQAADKAEKCADRSCECAQISCECAEDARLSADSAADNAAILYAYINAEAYDPDKIYNYINAEGKPDVVVCDDGYSYRCIGENIQGEYPPESVNWVRVPEVRGDIFTIVEYEDGFGITQNIKPGKKESDFFERKSDGSITFKNIVVGEEDIPRHFFPRNDNVSDLGLQEHRWRTVYAETLNVTNIKGNSSAEMSLPVISTDVIYLAVNKEVDTPGDVRIKNIDGVLTFEKCTVADSVKGGGTWVPTGTNFIQVNEDGSVTLTS